MSSNESRTAAANGALPADGRAVTELVSGPAPMGGTDQDPYIGTVIAERYRLVAKLGQGGMGAVYRGEHLTLRNKRVAVKFLLRELTSDAETVARFRREAETAADLEHPNVVAVNDFGSMPDGTHYLVMEYVEGRTLRDLLETDGRFAPGRAMHVLRQIGSALTRAHGRGVVHRDLKPENIVVVRRDGEPELVKVIDFGIARLTRREGTALTQMGSVFGTPQYMAPEQAMGQPVEGAADQYALGVIAFELLTGQRPFQADDAVDLLRMHVGAPIPSARNSVPELPNAVETVFARILAKRPSERFESVQAAIDALDAVLGTSAGSSGDRASRVGAAAPGWAAPAPSPLATTTTRLVGPGRKRALQITAGGIVALALLLAFVTRPVRTTGLPTTGTPPDPRPLDQRLYAYQQQPDVASAIARAQSGDVNAAVAVLAARQRANPRDAFAAYYLGTAYRYGRRTAQALEQFSAAVAIEPALGEDSTLVDAVIDGLSDSGASASAQVLLAGPLQGSETAARSVAEAAIDGRTASLRSTALNAVVAMEARLSPLDRARVHLRRATDCDALTRALTELESIDSGVAREESAAVRAGACSMLRSGALCSRCSNVRR